MSSSSSPYPRSSPTTMSNARSSTPEHLNVLCGCGLRAPLRTALTEPNVGRRFLGCVNYKMEEWKMKEDWNALEMEDLETKNEELMLKIDEVEAKNEELRLKIEDMEAKNLIFRGRNKLMKEEIELANVKVKLLTVIVVILVGIGIV
ncbi:hypothetical protein RHMOL_Rhmol10G0200200 [Rhododendron molle]|uniref:Uncharacterized protein n=1 Tax=Rhododendron molle TaxID=49168 RepID=A0ACC0M4H4_RHOML|nr:hypothetical protein RHMOL_Rhmol10G0200200 [Rhododendron molle]